MSDLEKGDRVRHPRMGDEWGLGQVLDVRGDDVCVFFVEVGEKTLSRKHVELQKVAAEAAAHPVLDNLASEKPGALSGYRSLGQCRDAFLAQFPEGFHDPHFVEQERDYKVTAHELALELLGRDVMARAIESEKHEDVCRGALQVVNKTNLMFPNEKMSLRDGLATDKTRRAFVEKLAALLHGDGDLQPRFEAWARLLIGIGAGKWPTATYFTFIVDPQTHMLVKPMALQAAAKTCGFDIAYRTEPNWHTYSKVLEFARSMRDQLADMQPRDMLDVQSFLWCIDPERVK